MLDVPRGLDLPTIFIDDSPNMHLDSCALHGSMFFSVESPPRCDGLYLPKVDRLELKYACFFQRSTEASFYGPLMCCICFRRTVETRRPLIGHVEFWIMSQLISKLVCVF